MPQQAPKAPPGLVLVTSYSLLHPPHCLRSSHLGFLPSSFQTQGVCKGCSPDWNAVPSAP